MYGYKTTSFLKILKLCRGFALRHGILSASQYGYLLASFYKIFMKPASGIDRVADSNHRSEQALRILNVS